ncbi:MAG: PLxRFG domain-containing protein, partial [Nitrospinota bacterium]|nr:PLxRFG domain-containing protein [Nitrospinota bacterium]
MLRNQDTADRWVSFGKSLAVMKYLWLNPKSAAVNMTALVTTVPPAIHEYAAGGKGSVTLINGTIARAVLDYGRALKTRSQGKPPTHLTKGEQAMLEEMAQKNWDDPQLAREARAELSGRMGKAWTWAMDKGMWPFAFTERINRGATMLAAYRVARRAFPEASQEALVKRAKHATDRAHGVYGKATQPLWAQGTGAAKRALQSALTFTKFGHNYLQMLQELGMEKKNARAFMYGVLSPGILAGAKATPLVGAYIMAADMIAKALGDDRDQEKRFFDMVAAELGKEGEKTIRYGLAGKVAGINISGSLEPNFGFLSPSRPSEVLGAVGGVINDFGYAWDRIEAGDYWGAAVKALPAGPGAIVKAVRESDGVKTGRGRPVYDDRGRPLTLATEDLLRLAAGFQPIERSYWTERNWEGRREAGNFSARKSRLYERLRFAYASGNRERTDALMEEVREYNRRAGEAGEPGITMEGIRRAMRSMNRATKRQVAVYR